MAQTSAAANSRWVMPGSDGTCEDDPTPGNRSGRSVAAAPAAHSASRRVIPKQPSAPAVANASVCGTDSCTLPARSSRDVNGPLAFRSSTMRSANSSPMCRTRRAPAEPRARSSPAWRAPGWRSRRARARRPRADGHRRPATAASRNPSAAPAAAPRRTPRDDAA